MSDPGVAVVFRGVGHRFGRRPLFAGLELEVGPGEVLVILGRNGAGKSTLLRLVAGLTQPAAGTVELVHEGRPLGPAARRQAVGYMAPATLPYRILTVRENLAFFARVRGLDEVAEEVVETVGLTARLDDPVAELSSGYVQRVKLALALLHRPAVLLLDEPGVTLDDAGRDQLDQVVAYQREHGLAMVAANDPRDAAYATRILRLGG